jgi:hypothetical protein
MDHDLIVEQLLERCQGFLESILQAPALPNVASVSLAIVTQMRPVARDILQAKLTLEAQPLTRAAITPCCPTAGVSDVQTRPVSPETLWGEITIPVRTFQCRGCGTTVRPDDQPLGVPEVGEFTDDGRFVYAPVAAELPPRVAKALFARCTGVLLRSCGGQRLIDSTAEDLRTWQAERETRETQAVRAAVTAGDGGTELRVAIALDGGTAPIDGRWQQPKVATILVRQREPQAEEPTLGAILARRSVCLLGTAEELAVGIQQALQEAGWERLAIGEVLGDGAPWIWKVAEAYVPGGRQTRDDSHLSEHL